MSEDFLHLLVGIGVPVALFAFGAWLRAENRNKREFQELARTNAKEHQAIRKDMTDQHHAIRDKIETIWQHMKNGSK